MAKAIVAQQQSARFAVSPSVPPVRRIIVPVEDAAFDVSFIDSVIESGTAALVHFLRESRTPGPALDLANEIGLLHGALRAIHAGHGKVEPCVNASLFVSVSAITRAIAALAETLWRFSTVQNAHAHSANEAPRS